MIRITIYQSKKLDNAGKKYSFPGEVVTFNWANQASQESIIAYLNLSKVYDYYRDNLSRISYDGHGSEIRAIVGYNIIVNNARWTEQWSMFKGKRIEFGTGGHEKALDTVAHEFTHGVMSSINGLGNKKESGALNEAYADIMGLLIEGKTNEYKWIMMEDTDTFTNDTALRRDLSKDQDSVRYTVHYSALQNNDYETIISIEDADQEGAHVYSTIFSHAAYLMMTDRKTSQIRDETWASVFYNSMFYLTSSSKFTDARNAVLVAAKNHGFSVAQMQAIRKAFDDVEIYTDVSKYGYELLAVKGRVIDQNTGDPVDAPVIKVIDKNSKEVMPVIPKENGEFLTGVLWIFSKEEKPTAEYFWDHYSVEIEKDGYNGIILSSGQDTIANNIYDLGTIELIPYAPILKDIDIEALPEFDSLESFLCVFDFGFAYDGGPYNEEGIGYQGKEMLDFEDDDIYSQVNVLDRLMYWGFFWIEPFKSIQPVEWIYSDEVSIPYPRSSTYYLYKSEDVDWFLQNIFNCSETSIQKMRDDSQSNPDDHIYYYTDGYYYDPETELEGGAIPVIVSAKYDGEFYYIAYDSFEDSFWNDEFLSMEMYRGRYYAVLKLKNIDGKNYWSVYRWYNTVSEDLGNIDSYHYNKLADEKFWQGDYQNTMEILQTGYEMTGDNTLLNKSDGMKKIAHPDYENQMYVRDISAPVFVENIMGLSGFYVDTHGGGGFLERDYYSINPQGVVTHLGTGGGMGGGYAGIDIDLDLGLVVDVNHDGVTELITHGISGNGHTNVCVYRMNDGIVECATIGFDDLDRLAPNKAEWGGRFDGDSWYDVDEGAFYLQYTPQGANDDEEYDYLKYHDLSPFIFEAYEP